jgi:hypothetical protein
MSDDEIVTVASRAQSPGEWIYTLTPHQIEDEWFLALKDQLDARGYDDNGDVTIKHFERGKLLVRPTFGSTIDFAAVEEDLREAMTDASVEVIESAEGWDKDRVALRARAVAELARSFDAL